MYVRSFSYSHGMRTTFHCIYWWMLTRGWLPRIHIVRNTGVYNVLPRIYNSTLKQQCTSSCIPLPLFGEILVNNTILTNPFHRDGGTEWVGGSYITYKESAKKYSRKGFPNLHLYFKQRQHYNLILLFKLLFSTLLLLLLVLLLFLFPCLASAFRFRFSFFFLSFFAFLISDTFLFPVLDLQTYMIFIGVRWATTYLLTYWRAVQSEVRSWIIWSRSS